MNTKDILKLTPRQRTSLDAIIKSPLAERAIAEAEAEKVTERRALAARLRELESLAAKEAPAAAAEKQEADTELQKAQAAMPLLVQRAVDAANRLRLVERHKARGKVERELRDGSDPRLKDWRHYLEALAGYAANAFRSAPHKEITPFGLRTVVATNADEVSAARAVLGECIARANLLELAPLSYLEVSAALTEMGERLQGPLAALQLNPPQLANDGEVGRPLPWADGRPMTWRVEEIGEPLPKKVTP